MSGGNHHRPDQHFILGSMAEPLNRYTNCVVTVCTYVIGRPREYRPREYTPMPDLATR
jgi:hypothetical protein